MPHVETEHRTSTWIKPDKRADATKQPSISISTKDDDFRNIMIFGTRKDRRDVWTESLSGLTTGDLTDIRDCIDTALDLLEDDA